MARITEGRVFRRKVKGTLNKHYSARYYINGKEFKVVLLDDYGNKITNKALAQQALKALLEPAQRSTDADRRRAHSDALKLAETKLAEAEAEKEKQEREKQLELQARRALKICDAWDTFVSPDERLKPDCSERNLNNYKGYWNAFKEWLSDQPESVVYMREVSDVLAKRYANKLENRGLSDNTFNKHRAFLLSFFKALSDKIQSEINPFEVIQRKDKVKAVKRRDLTSNELKNVLTKAKGELGLLLWIGATTGLRLGDAATLEWEAIDLDTGLIRLYTRKTDTAVTIGILPVLAELLMAMPEDQREGFVMPDIAAQYNNLKQRPHLVARIQDFFTSCGIKIHKPGTGGKTGKRAVTVVGFHSLRHSFATLLGDAEVADSTAQKLLGHSRAAMTHYYQHELKNAAINSAQKLDNTFRKILSTSQEFKPDVADGHMEQAALEEPERKLLRELVDGMSLDDVKHVLKYLSSKSGNVLPKKADKEK